MFELNECGQSGTVLASSTDTRITVEGGTFSTNYAGEVCGHDSCVQILYSRRVEHRTGIFKCSTLSSSLRHWSHG